MAVYVENGLRYSAVLDSLAKRTDIVVVGKSVSSTVDERKGRTYEDTTIIVASSRYLEPTKFPDFVGGVLDDVEPVFRRKAWLGTLGTFDTVVPGRKFHRISVEVFPSVPAAQEAIK